MKIKKPGIALLVAFVSVFGMSQTASANSHVPCGAQLDALKAELNDSYCSYTRKKHCKGLNHKLDNVYRQLAKGKFKKAGRKLGNFYDVVENLATRKKRPQMTMEQFGAMMDPHYLVVQSCIELDGNVPEEPEVEEPVVNPGWDLDNE